MNDVPLIRKTDVNDINTSLIAIKKQLKQLNEAVGLIDVPDVDLTPFVRKDEVVNVVETGNMNPVTSNAVAQCSSYSTEEVFTGSYWIDGKKIYRKTINCGTLPNSTTKNVSFTISNLDKGVKLYGFANSSSGTCIPLPYYNTDGNGVQIWFDSNKIFIRDTANWSPYTGYVTLEYTKTTDTATRSIPTEETREIDEEERR